MKEKNPIVTIFGSSRPTPNDPEYLTAYELGNLLANAGFEICNGGYGGIMEASAQGAKDGNGKTIGVVTEYFQRSANRYIDEVITVKTLIDRLQKLIALADAYVVLKGSTGTLVELSLVWEYMNKSAMKVKPIIVVGNFWTPVVDTLRKELTHEGSEVVTQYITLVDSPRACVEELKKNM